MGQQIVQIQHAQTVTIDSESPRWSETYAVSVALFSEALSSGWLAQFFGHHANDLVLLFTLMLHGRPLQGEQLDELVQRGLATPNDAGRLYCAASDRVLADELKGHRTTIAECAERLAARGLLTIADLRDEDPNTHARHPRQSRDGQYLPGKIYVLAGELHKVFKKNINRVGLTDTVNSGKSRGVGNTDTGNTEKNHGVGITDTVKAPTVSVKPTSHVGNTDTNIKDSDDDEGDDDFSTFSEVCAVLEKLNRQPYRPGGKDRAALQALLAAGYAPADILAAVHLAFQRAPDKKHRIVHCAAICRETLPQTSANVKSEIRPPEEIRDSVGEQSEIRNISNQARAGDVPAAPVPDSPDLQAAVIALRQAVKPCTEAHLLRLQHMAQEAQPAAERVGETGAQWVLEAVKVSLTADDPVRYAATILRGWNTHGKHCDLRPVRSNTGDKPPKTKSTKWAERISH